MNAPKGIPHRFLNIDKLAEIYGPLPEGMDIDDVIRETSHDAADRRHLRLQVQYWREEHHLPGLDEFHGYITNLVDLDGLVQKLAPQYTQEELKRLMPEVFDQAKDGGPNGSHTAPHREKDTGSHQ